ncbi:hypothetical protein C0995_000712 [Termitomyces sp. Mi166|nr:hypothetical protein C0995_000712 [Termitomyces sp. Mi166\
MSGWRPERVSPSSAGKDASANAKCYKCSKQDHFVRECKELARLAPQGYIHATHTAALTDIDSTINNANDKQENEPGEEEAEQASQDSEEDKANKEYVELNAYENKYYTCDSNSKALFVLANEPVEKIFGVNLVDNIDEDHCGSTKEVHMCKVKVLAFKKTLVCLVPKAPNKECLVLKALDKECLVTWVESITGGRLQKMKAQKDIKPNVEITFEDRDMSPPQPEEKPALVAKRLRDRPISKPTLEWAYNSQMLEE